MIVDCDVETPEIDRVHVYPLFGKPHVFDVGVTCWCEPQPDDQNPNVLVHRPDH